MAITMELINKENKLVITIKQKTIHFGLPKKFDNNLMQETDFITKCNKLLAELMIRNKVSWLFS